MIASLRESEPLSFPRIPRFTPPSIPMTAAGSALMSEARKPGRERRIGGGYSGQVEAGV